MQKDTTETCGTHRKPHLRVDRGRKCGPVASSSNDREKDLIDVKVPTTRVPEDVFKLFQGATSVQDSRGKAAARIIWIWWKKVRRNKTVEVPQTRVPNDVFEIFQRSTSVADFRGKTGLEHDAATFVHKWIQIKLIEHKGAVPQNIGRFWFSASLDSKRRTRLRMIQKEFTDKVIKEKLLPMISRTGKEKGEDKKLSECGRVSLRALDWLVTNYSKKTQCAYSVKPPGLVKMRFNVFKQYKAWLTRYKRVNFDPFRRHIRVYFTFENQIYSSTVGQLNFMDFAFKNGVLEYAQSNLIRIQNDMEETMKRNAKERNECKSRGIKRKRKPLSEMPKHKVFVYSIAAENVF